MTSYDPNLYQAKEIDDDGYIHYSSGEHLVWAELFESQSTLVKNHMVKEYVEGLAYIDLPKHKIPQCSEVSAKLKEINGWQIEPVSAMTGYKRFFTMLANKRFPAASFIRSKDDFDYVTGPDIFHEIFGHGPLLTHPQVVQFSQYIGELGMNMSPENQPWLSRIYWFTIEYGLIKQSSMQGDNKINSIVPMGSAIASSPTELVYASNSQKPQRRPFKISEVLASPTLFGINQPHYFVLESFEQLAEITERNLLADILKARAIHAEKHDQQINLPS